MVRKAETVPWVRTGNITRAQVNINLSAEWSTAVVRESHTDTVVGGAYRHSGRQEMPLVGGVGCLELCLYGIRELA